MKADQKPLVQLSIIFWEQLESLLPAEKLPYFLKFSQVVVGIVDLGLASRRDAGEALSPGWASKEICSNGDMTIALDCAHSFRSTLFESHGEADIAWKQMCDILQKYWT